MKLARMAAAEAAVLASLMERADSARAMLAAATVGVLASALVAAIAAGLVFTRGPLYAAANWLMLDPLSAQGAGLKAETERTRRK